MKISQIISEKFVSLGKADWVDGKGLQIDISDVPSAPGVYVMFDDDGQIQKVGKSATSLKQRLGFYRSADASLSRKLAAGEEDYDKSSMRQRNAIKSLGVDGLNVAYMAASVEVNYFAGLEEERYSFDASSREKSMKALAVSEGHPLKFGPM